MTTENEDLNDQSVRYSFYITYVFLLTTGTITFIEALRTTDYRVRNILNLETCISVVAAYFYGNFMEMLDNTEVTNITESEENNDNNTKAKENKMLNYEKINNMRYVDWSITTPIMLLVLCLALLYNVKGGALNFLSFLFILICNYGMLGMGYIGEIGLLSKLNANIGGFGFFALLYGFIYKEFLHKKTNNDNGMLYWAFFILWSLYGVFYMLDTESKIIGYNILDLFSKCFVGIFFWAYFTKVFKL